MAKNKDIDDLDIGSSYDDFYFDLCIINELTDIKNAEDISQSELGIPLQPNVRGILYFYELVIIDMISHLENLTQNINIQDILHWSHSDISEEAIRILIKIDPVVEYIFKFNKFRKELTTTRLTDAPITHEDYQNLIKIADQLRTMVEQANKLIIDNLKIIKLENNNEHDLLVFQFILKYNYIRRELKNKTRLIMEEIKNLPDATEDEFECVCPGEIPFFYIMPRKTIRSYYLHDKKIIKYNNEYLNGYKAMLITFYKSKLSNETYNIVKELITKTTTWSDIHKVYQKLINLVIKPPNMLQPIFRITNEQLIKEIIPGTKISNKIELDLLFRRINNMLIKVVRSNEIYNAGALFQLVLLGAGSVLEKNIEVLEFKQIYGDEIRFSYALYIPLSGWISDASYWLFFDDLGAASIDGSYHSSGKIFIDKYLQDMKQSQKYMFHSYEVNGDLLQKYIYNKDMHELETSILNEKVKSGKGLLGQFIAYLYLAKKYDAKLIDISKNIGLTDIDVIAENSEKLFLVQAKTTFPFSKKSLNELYAHFETIEKSITTTKQIQKMLFVSNEEEFDEDCAQHMFDNELDEMDDTDINTQRESVRNDLKLKKIDVLTYKDLREILSVKEYEDFLAKIDKVIDYSELDFEDYWA